MTAGLAPGTLLGGRYRIVRLLAEGGMGAVYEATHLELGRRVAIKTLLSELQDQPRLIQRFIREARATCTIAHPNVVSVLDVDQTPEGIIFFAMEYLEGSDLEQTLEREGTIAWPRARHIALQLCAALGSAHDRGVVHRDLKPSNCFLVRDDTGAEVVKVLDFGIAKVLESSATRPAGDADPAPSRRGTGRDLRWLKTSTGEVFGTLAYMAPEHLNGDPHDHRVDIYALGVILHEMLTGAPPFSPDAPGTFIQQVLFEPPEPPSRHAAHAKIPPDLDYVVLRALEKRPEDRFKNMDELAAALTAVRREAAPPIALAPWTPPSVPPMSLMLVGASVTTSRSATGSVTTPRSPNVARVSASEVRTTPRGRAGVPARLGLPVALAVGVLLLGAWMLRTWVTAPAPGVASGSIDPAGPAVAEPASATVAAPPGESASSAVVATSVEPASPTVVAPSVEPASSTVVASPAIAVPAAEPESVEIVDDEPAANPDVAAPTSGPKPGKPRVATPPRPRDLPPMTVTPFERQKLLANHRSTIAARCKRPRGLDNALLVLQVTIEAARIVRATSSDQDRSRQAAARCIEKYLRTQVDVPKSMTGRASFSYAF